MATSQIFRSRDFRLAAFLLSRKHAMIDASRDDQGRVIFAWYDSDHLRFDVNDLQFGDAMVSARDLYAAINRVKDVIAACPDTTSLTCCASRRLR